MLIITLIIFLQGASPEVWCQLQKIIDKMEEFKEVYGK